MTVVVERLLKREAKGRRLNPNQEKIGIMRIFFIFFFGRIEIMRNFAPTKRVHLYSRGGLKPV
jgi:hypothetical protein